MIAAIALVLIIGIALGAIGHHLYVIGDEGFEDRKQRIDLNL